MNTVSLTLNTRDQLDIRKGFITGMPRALFVRASGYSSHLFLLEGAWRSDQTVVSYATLTRSAIAFAFPYLFMRYRLIYQ